MYAWSLLDSTQYIEQKMLQNKKEKERLYPSLL